MNTTLFTIFKDTPATRTYGWTKQQEQFLIENAGKISVSKIAKKIGKGVDTTEKKLKRLRKSGAIDPVDLKAKYSERTWPAEHEQFIIDNHKKMTIEQMSKSLGKTHDAVHHRISKLIREGRLERKVKALDDSEIDYIVENYSEQTVKELAKNLGRTFYSVRWAVERLKKEGVLKGDFYKGGNRAKKEQAERKALYPLLKIFEPENNPPAQPKGSWTDEGIEWLIKNYQSMTKDELAQKFNKSINTISAKLSELRTKGVITGSTIYRDRTVTNGSNF